MATFYAAIPVVLAHEGHISNDKDDPGGLTKYGVSLRYLQQRGLDVDGDGDIDEQDVHALTLEFIKNDIYHKDFWHPLYDKIASQDIATNIFDFAVNAGPEQSHRNMQRALNELGFKVGVDGRFGPITLAAINTAHGAGLERKVWSQFNRGQCDFYVDLAIAKPKSLKFLKGWIRRAWDC